MFTLTALQVGRVMQQSLGNKVKEMLGPSSKRSQFAGQIR